MKLTEFVEPENVEDGDYRLVILKGEIQMIEAQLGESRFIDDAKKTDEFYEWKSKARFALVCRNAEKRLLKHWLWKNNTIRKTKLKIAIDYLSMIADNQNALSVSELEMTATRALNEMVNVKDV